MTTQSELLKLADRHTDNKAVCLLLLSLSEARTAARQHLHYVAAASKTLELAVQAQEGYSVGYNQSDYVTAAAKASSLVERMAADFVTLAGVLRGLGEDICY